jgi:starch phosphorylase
VIPVTPRRWLDQCNPGLSALITETLKIPKSEWLKDLKKLEGLLEFADDPKFQKKWAAIKQTNKERLAHYVETTLGVKVNTKAMFDVQVKRLHEYKVRCGCRTASGVVWLTADDSVKL